jgi:copper chaperone CopZ
MRALAVLAGLLLVQGALACGYCVEDKIAAAYDHAVVVSALDRRHEVAFLSIEGTTARSRERSIAGAVESVAGVDRGTVRVSLEGGAVSFAFDPARIPARSIVDSVRKKLAAKGVRVTLLRVLDDKIGASARL